MKIVLNSRLPALLLLASLLAAAACSTQAPTAPLTMEQTAEGKWVIVAIILSLTKSMIWWWFSDGWMTAK